jgi:hypothetical protein
LQSQIASRKVQILKLLSYFDIFNHPLAKGELINLCGESENSSSYDIALSELSKTQKCFSTDDFYSPKENITELVTERKNKEKEASKYFKKLPFYTKIIKSFPFVRGIAISGSLSKSVMFNDGDIDYFIVTRANRLWICRSLLIIFKKLFLLNSKKYFCVNYFVDENNLKIIDENIFTAIEITYLAPVYNKDLIEKLKEANNWTKSYFPNFKHPLQFDEFEGHNYFKKIIESLFRGNIGDRIDLFFMKVTYNRWKVKFKHFNPEKFELTMRTNRGVSKHHPLDFQNRVIKEYQERLNRFGIS